MIIIIMTSWFAIMIHYSRHHMFSFFFDICQPTVADRPTDSLIDSILFVHVIVELSYILSTMFSGNNIDLEQQEKRVQHIATVVSKNYVDQLIDELEKKQASNDDIRKQLKDKATKYIRKRIVYLITVNVMFSLTNAQIQEMNDNIDSMESIAIKSNHLQQHTWSNDSLCQLLTDFASSHQNQIEPTSPMNRKVIALAGLPEVLHDIQMDLSGQSIGPLTNLEADVRLKLRLVEFSQIEDYLYAQSNLVWIRLFSSEETQLFLHYFTDPLFNLLIRSVRPIKREALDKILQDVDQQVYKSTWNRFCLLF